MTQASTAIRGKAQIIWLGHFRRFELSITSGMESNRANVRFPPIADISPFPHNRAGELALMIVGLVLSAVAAATGHQPRCAIRIGELVPDAQVARDLATAIISSRQTPEQRSRYVLRVEQDGTTGWLVFQSLPDAPAGENGKVTVTAGGGGLGMRIDRCNGAMSRVFYQR